MIETKRNRRFGVNILQVPSERFALQFFSQLKTFAHITRLDFHQLGHELMKIGRVLVRPYVDQTARIFKYNFFRAARKFILYEIDYQTNKSQLL